jgi:electron transfer flavoprotein alpha subunit
MAKLIVHKEKITDREGLIKLCPFGAIVAEGDSVAINDACKMCRLCIKKGPAGAVEYVEDQKPALDKVKWRGIAVYAECTENGIHPVSLELIGKARELAEKTGQTVYALLPGYQLEEAGKELLHYGVREVHLYDQPELARFNIETYAAAFEDFIRRVHPSSILVGATVIGRQLAPRVAARMRTGLTADCTQLEIKENTDLIQIRPAFGGNIMAQIFTPNHRPQMATVRYKVMDAPQRSREAEGKLKHFTLPPERLESRIEVRSVSSKVMEQSIDGADVLVVAGRGVKKDGDLEMLKELAQLLGGQLACTRPLVECGWVEARRQVGLSGRTVRPKLIITCGVSGAIQFVAGMNHADTIVAINKDEKAPIFKVAHYGLVGDLYEIVPRLIQDLRLGREKSL